MKVGLFFIKPSSPWENDQIESFNGKPRNELLDREIFYSLREAQVLIKDWRQHFEMQSSHSALGYRSQAPEITEVLRLNHLAHGRTQ